MTKLVGFATALGGTMLFLMNTERIMRMVTMQTDAWSADKQLEAAAVAKAHVMKAAAGH
eukprot:CAMPEP_0174715030 /NCGR_PEP_ID=MMETSP1094-20130205/19886_1 /TAXON_ID=156173 /ORGANISM="Chrysochromulina brevifilum, Strain UTEX LB 985" /LENGTH=58 /DNA_ID=CAMNT_0015914525 /DNA_START=37 /DNA_END=213 /DNA_ORIENTATION=+